MAFLLSIFLGIAPMLCFAYFIYWLDRYEKEPLPLLGGAFLWGAVIAAGMAFLVNTIIGVGIYLATNSEKATELTTGSLIAPVVEETLKGFAVLLVFLVFRSEFDSILDGMIYAGITALGFAATENIYYIYNGYLENGWPGLLGLAFIRIVLVGWQHPFYTAFFGIGLAIARLTRNVLLQFIAPFAGLAMAMLTHAAHNTIGGLISGLRGLAVGTLLDWTGWFMMLLFTLWMIMRERNYLVRYLQEEISLGNLTSQQYRQACSAWAPIYIRTIALFKGKHRLSTRFFQVCGELAHKKHQLARVGEEDRNSQIIEKLRVEMRRLSSQLGTL